MDYLKKLNSREMMLVQKRDELENAFIIKKQFDEVRNLLPSFDELFEFFKDREWWTKYELIVVKESLIQDYGTQQGHVFILKKIQLV